MNLSWATNLYDKDGDEYDKCVLLFVDDRTILRFSNPKELQAFAEEILSFSKAVDEYSHN